MALRDILAGEDKDQRSAADAAAHGRSITGFSGRHTDVDDRFTNSREALFGARSSDSAPPQPEPPGPVTSVNDPIIPWDAPGLRRQGNTFERKPFGDAEQQLSYPPRPGYRRYWANDRPGRIKRFIQAGYAHVTDPETGENIVRTTDVIDGRGQQSYLMEQPIEWYQADMAQNARRLAERLDDIRNGRAGPGSDDSRYIPKQGITIQGR
jgi:hypothetical protein